MLTNNNFSSISNPFYLKSKIFIAFLVLLLFSSFTFFDIGGNHFSSFTPEISLASSNNLFEDIKASGKVEFADKDVDGDAITNEVRTTAIWISGLLAISMLVCFLWQVTKLGAAGSNEQARKKASMGILTSGIALALFGGSTVLVAFFWNALKPITE